MKIDKEKFDEIYDAGCWPSGITEDDEKILQFVLKYEGYFHHVAHSNNSYNCECEGEVWDIYEDENYDDPYKFQQRIERLQADIYRFESFVVDQEVDSEEWQIFFFDEVDEMYREKRIPVSVFTPFYEQILGSNPEKLKEMILGSDEAWQGFCVGQCPKCKRWSISD